MIKQLVYNKVDEIFLELQNANFITDGGIEPYDANGIDRCIDELAMYIERVIEYQKQNEKKPKLKELLELFDNVDWDEMSIGNNEMCVKIKFDTH